MSESARRKPGPAPSLSFDQVCRVAIEVMAVEGLAGVSFRSVSKRLGVNPMALYTYVRDKDELLAGMFDSIMGSLQLSPNSTASAIEQLVDYYSRARELLIAHADLYRLARPAAVAGTDWAVSETLCALLAELGLGDREIVETQQTLLQFTVGNALYWAILGPSTLPSGVTAESAQTLAALDATQYPMLNRLARVAIEGGADPQARFQDTIRQLLKAPA